MSWATWKMGYPCCLLYQKTSRTWPLLLVGFPSGPTVLEETRAFAAFASNGNYHDSRSSTGLKIRGNVVFQPKQPTQVFGKKIPTTS